MESITLPLKESAGTVDLTVDASGFFVVNANDGKAEYTIGGQMSNILDFKLNFDWEHLKLLYFMYRKISFDDFDSGDKTLTI